MEIKDRTIALLIDSENISSDYFSIILDELSQYGRVTYRRLYGDFTKDIAKGWKEAFKTYSIEQIQQVSFTSRKNASDSKMIIDAMDILYKGNVDCFCLATSDSDFTNLAMRFRNENLVVIGAGEEKTPLSFRKACDIFIPVDELLKAKKEKDSVSSAQNINKSENKNITVADKKNTDSIQSKIKKLIKTAKAIVSQEAGADGWLHFSSFMNEIHRNENDFNPILYGAQSGKPIPFFKELTENGKKVFILEKKDNIDKIRINKNSTKKTQKRQIMPDVIEF